MNTLAHLAIVPVLKDGALVYQLAALCSDCGKGAIIATVEGPHQAAMLKAIMIEFVEHNTAVTPMARGSFSLLVDTHG